MKCILSIILTLTCIIINPVFAQENIFRGISCGLAIPDNKVKNDIGNGISFGGHLLYSKYISDKIETGTVISLGIQIFHEKSELQMMIIPLNVDWNLYLGKEKTRGIARVGFGLNSYIGKENAKTIIAQDKKLGFGFWPAFHLGTGVNLSVSNKKQIDIILEYSNLLYLHDKSWIFNLKFNLHFR